LNIKLRNLGIRFVFCGALVISSLYIVWPDPITATAQIGLIQDGHRGGQILSTSIQDGHRGDQILSAPAQDGHGGDQVLKSLTQDAASSAQIPQDSAASSADGADITRVSVSTSKQTPRRVVN